MDLQILTVDDIIDINKYIISNFGGSHTVLNKSLLEQSVNSPYHTFGGQDLYETTIDKAVQLCYSLCKNHCFVDGNKRTALISMLVFLDINNINVDNLNYSSLSSLINGVAEGSKNKQAIYNWLETNL